MNGIYEEEYTREQARIAARKDAEPKPKKKNQLLPFVALAMLAIVFGYAGIIIGGAVGFNTIAFLEMDFIISVAVLTGLFIWLMST